MKGEWKNGFLNGKGTKVLYDNGVQDNIDIQDNFKILNIMEKEF